MSQTSVSLAALTLSLKDPADPYKKVQLNKIRDPKDEDKRRDFLLETSEILENLLDKLNVLTTIGNAAKIIRLETDGRFVKGVIETGRSGTIQNIFDTETGKRSYATTKKDAIMVPHYFLFRIPEGHHKAVVLMQRYGQSGIQTILLEYLESEFKKRFPG